MFPGFYTGWLLPAALVGLLVFLYGLCTMHSNQLAAEVCDSGTDFNMCPLCDIDVGCNFWSLSEVCSYAQLAYLFDHPGTVFYAVFMSFWGECEQRCKLDVHMLFNNTVSTA
jgi:anoctamin-7